MTSQLKISLANVMHGIAPEAAALADVVPVDAKNGTRLRDVVIPVYGGNDWNWATVDVEPGRYLVQTVLSTGELIDSEVEVAPGASAKVLLEGHVTPHEWLGWQRFTPGREALWDANDFVSKAASIPVRAALLTSREWMNELPRLDNQIPYSQRDGVTTAFEVTDHPWAVRTFMILDRGRRRDAVVLPVPWGRYEPKPVQVAVRDDEELPLYVAVQDPRLGPLLGYVSAGDVSAARKVLRSDDPDHQQFIEMLYSKYQNPFAAVVAGYVLVSAPQAADALRWHPWIENLANDFEWIADGAILSGWIALQRNDRDQAKHRFRQAIQRGIPVLTGTLRLLHQGLLMVNDPSSLATVSAALARADMTQPFVTLRFDEETT